MAKNIINSETGLEQSKNWEKHKDNAVQNMENFPYNEGFPTGAYIGKLYTLKLCNGETQYNRTVNDSQEFMAEGKSWRVNDNAGFSSSVMAWKEQKEPHTAEV